MEEPRMEHRAVRCRGIVVESCASNSSRRHFGRFTHDALDHCSNRTCSCEWFRYHHPCPSTGPGVSSVEIRSRLDPFEHFWRQQDVREHLSWWALHGD